MTSFQEFIYPLAAMLLAAAVPQTALAHFLWVVTDIDTSPATAKVYFAEGPEGDDPDLLTRVEKAQAYSLSGMRGEPKQLTLKKDDDALVAELPRGAEGSPVFLRHTYGVISRGGSTFLLNYYAKTYPTALPGTWNPVAEKEMLPLEVTPEFDGEEVVFQVDYLGEAAIGAELQIEGPGLKKIDGKVNDRGQLRCKLPESGLFAIRAKLVEDKKGEHDGDAYDQVRHYSTLTLRRSPAAVKSASANLPELPRGSTSLGAAVSGDTLYVYGGNYGGAHEYSKEDQSGDLWVLNLRKPTEWKRLSKDEHVQGLAMVEHQGSLYRVGGFRAMNEEGEDQDLRSQKTVSRYDIANGQWEQMPDMPAGRSSHDAAVLNGVMYVVGGWTLAGESENTVWHENMLAYDLSAKSPQWKPIAMPFKRRALAVAAFNDKLYVIGGMRDQRGPTRETAVFDPATGKWSTGPTLQGGGLEGFGASAFAVGGSLYVSTISGSIQRLSDDGKKWEYAGQEQYPRFFHRMVPYNGKLVLVGGGSMSAGGKVLDVEVLESK